MPQYTRYTFAAYPASDGGVYPGHVVDGYTTPEGPGCTPPKTTAINFAQVSAPERHEQVARRLGIDAGEEGT